MARFSQRSDRLFGRQKDQAKLHSGVRGQVADPATAQGQLVSEELLSVRRRVQEQEQAKSSGELLILIS